MIKIKLIGYHFQNCPGFCVERPTGSGDYLLLYLRRPTEIMKDGHYIKVPENTFILYEKNKPQIYQFVFGETKNIADAVLFVSGEEGSFINGASLVVDGGMSCN